MSVYDNDIDAMDYFFFDLQCKYQMSNDVTTFSSVSMPTVLPTGNSPEVPYTRICGEVMGTQLCSPISTHLPQRCVHSAHI